MTELRPNIAQHADVIYPLTGKRVFVAGHGGLVGSAIVRRLARVGCDIVTMSRSACDLRNQDETSTLMEQLQPHAVFLAAGTVGGIHANSTYPADFIRNNMMIAANVISSAYDVGVSKLLYLGSSCIYPKHASQPMTEDALLTGLLEPTNEPYAIAKIAGIKLCDAYRQQYGADFVSVMPTNLYGLGDNYHPENAHVPAALIRRFDAAKRDGATTVTVWGTGAPLREFLCSDDLADACVFLMERHSWSGPLNVGTGDEVTIAELARTIAEVVGYQGRIVFDATRPDGAPRKRLDVTRLSALGWRPRTTLRDGLAQAYADYVAGGGRYR